MVRETWVQSQFESYQKLKKWYLMPPCLTLSIIRYVSKVKWNNKGNGVAPSPTPWCRIYRKGNLQVTIDYGRQLYSQFESLSPSCSTVFFRSFTSPRICHSFRFLRLVGRQNPLDSKFTSFIQLLSIQAGVFH